MGTSFVKICFCSFLHLFLPTPLSYIYNFVIIIVDFWRKKKMPRLATPYINLSSNALKRELKETLTTDWNLNLPLTKFRDEIWLLKQQNISFYSDSWIHLRKLRDKNRNVFWRRIPLPSSCSHQLPKRKVRNQKHKTVSTKKYHPLLLDEKDITR